MPLSVPIVCSSVGASVGALFCAFLCALFCAFLFALFFAVFIVFFCCVCLFIFVCSSYFEHSVFFLFSFICCAQNENFVGRKGPTSSDFGKGMPRCRHESFLGIVCETFFFLFFFFFAYIFSVFFLFFLCWFSFSFFLIDWAPVEHLVSRNCEHQELCLDTF